jgi:hypothetical protein
MFWLIALLACVPSLLHFALICYVLGCKQRFPAEPAFTPIHPQADVLSPVVRQHFERVEVFSREAGFQPAGFVTHDLGEVDTFIALYHHPAQDHVLMAVVMVTKIEQFGYAEFQTETRDGLAVVTNNTTRLGMFPKSRRQSTAWLPMVTGLDRLYAAHRARLQRLNNPFHKKPDLRSPAEYMVREWRGPLEELERRGWVRRVEAEYQTTWIGTVGMAARLTWPITLLRRGVRSQRSARLLRALGV